MELINWSLSAIDKIFSQRSRGIREPACPGETFHAGYTQDAWNKWKVMCLTVLSVEDSEDIYVFGTLIAGILLIGSGIALVYRKSSKQGAVNIGLGQHLQKMKTRVDENKSTLMELHQKVTLIEELLTKSVEKDRKLIEELLTKSVEKDKKLDYIGGQTGELCRRFSELSTKTNELYVLFDRLVSRA